jgi:hypothetical protein
MKTTFLCSILAVSASLLSASASENTRTNAAGHWEGAISLPTATLEVRVDLQGLADKWQGTIDIPPQGLRGFKLDPVTVRSNAVVLGMPGIPGDPQFEGELSSDRASISGQFRQGGQEFPFKLQRKAKTEIMGETPSKGVPGKGLAGFWQGSLKPLAVVELRLSLELTNNGAGMPGGVLVSLDQGGARIDITGLTETNGMVHFRTPSVGGAFEGKLSEDGSEIAGSWSQGGQSTPLVFKRLTKAVRLSKAQEPKNQAGKPMTNDGSQGERTE